MTQAPRDLSDDDAQPEPVADGEAPALDAKADSTAGAPGDPNANAKPAKHTPRSAKSVALSALRVIGIALVALAGGALGWALAPNSTATLGPLSLDISVGPSIHPNSSVQMPPFGEVSFDTHSAPIAITATVENVDLDQAETLIGSSSALAKLEDNAPGIIIGAVCRSLGFAAAGSVLGAAAAVFLVYRNKKRTIAAASTVAIVIVAVGAGAGATFNPDAMSQPSFSGLISRAPYIAQQSTDALARLESYRSGLADIIRNVSAVYAQTENLPSLPSNTQVITALHVSDIHLNPIAFDLIRQLVPQFNVDLVIDTGDITTWGTPVESQTLHQISSVEVPYVFVGGNHDSQATAAFVATQPNAIVLNDDVQTVAGLTIAGIPDPRFIADDNSGSGAGFEAGKDAVEASTKELAKTITAYDKAHPDEPVNIAAIHDASRSESLFGTVPVILAGHVHSRSVTLEADHTWLMVEGSTGAGGPAELANNAGIGSKAEDSTKDAPLDMTATLLYFAASGDDKGKLLAYDEVTVGGLGLASITIKRTVISLAEEEMGEPTPTEPVPSPPSESPQPADSGASAG